jgi:formamidopyrimidine-DNA glycosylase
MPEGPEVAITRDYLATRIIDKTIMSVSVISGRYTHQTLEGKELIKKGEYKITNINSKGKLLWICAKNKLDEYIYIINTFGLTGSWGFYEQSDSRIKFVLKGDKEYNLYYNDTRNFGTMQITNNEATLHNRTNKLGDDLLKTEYTADDIMKKIKKLNGDYNLVEILMNQTKNGIGSGLGNYLVAEVLYRAKLSPYRTLKSLTKTDVENLTNSIKYITKLSYYNNKTGYMTNFGNYIDRHREKIDNGELPNYHPDVKLKDKEFAFKVYQQKRDPYGNVVTADNIIKGRKTHWVKDVQV